VVGVCEAGEGRGEGRSEEVEVGLEVWVVSERDVFLR
jgi:hypothetical protein